jgi:hypothetical protein
MSWLYLLVGIATGYFGTRLWWGNGEPNWWLGTPLQLLSAWLLWMAFPARASIPKDPPAPQSNVFSRPKPGSFSPFYPFALAIVGQILFAFHQLVPGLIFWCFSITLFRRLAARTAETSSQKTFKPEYKWLGLILLLAVLMRFPFLGQFITGFQIDEANHFNEARNVLAGLTKSPFVTVWYGSVALHYFALALMLKIFGASCAAAKAFSAVVSIGVLVVFYLWCRLFFGSKASLMATFLMAVNWWFMYFSLSMFQNMLLCLFEVLTFYFLEKALLTGKRSDFWWAGVSLALCFMEYLPGRLVPAMFLSCLVLFWAVKGKAFWKAYAKPLFLSILAFFWLAVPFIYFAIKEPYYFFLRSKEISIFNEVHGLAQLGYVLKRIFWTLATFVWPNPHVDERFYSLGFSELDPLSGAFLVFGLLITILSFRKRVSGYILVGLVFGVATNVLAIQGPNTHPAYVNCLRYFTVVPFLFLAVARFFDWVYRYSEVFNEKVKSIGRILLAAALAGVLAWNIVAYYFSFKTQTQWGVLGYPHFQIAEYLQSHYPAYHLLVGRDCYTSLEQVLTNGRVKVPEPYTDFDLPVKNKVEKNVLFVFRYDLPGQNLIRKYYPKAVWGELRDKWGEPAGKTVEVSKADIEAAQKGLTLTEPLP